MRRILVVDDDPHVCQAVGAWLRQHGFRVSVADGGISGLDALDKATFDLMIVDIFMPDMSGFESIRLFHQRAPGVPLIAISGSAFPDPETSAPDLLRIAAMLGATRCLRKPFKPATLLSVIDACLSETEPHRRHVVTLGAVANTLSKSADGAVEGLPRLKHDPEKHALGRRPGGWIPVFPRDKRGTRLRGDHAQTRG
jgi:DNA-binding response OmpR family regulator